MFGALHCATMQNKKINLGKMSLLQLDRSHSGEWALRLLGKKVTKKEADREKELSALCFHYKTKQSYNVIFLTSK